MRAVVIHILAVLLIAIFAIGAPQLAKAACAQCRDCSTEAPAKNHAPCPEKGLVCQVAQACASQALKAPAQLQVDAFADAGDAGFRHDVSIAVSSAYLTPETAPPRA